MMSPRLLTSCALLSLGAFTAFAEPGHVFSALTAEQTASIKAALPPKATAKPKQPRRVLVFYRTEGFVHSCIPFANEAVTQLGRATGAFEVELSDDMAVFESKNLQRFDAILFNSTTGLKFENPEHRAALLARLRSGAGLIGLHAATDNFPTWPEARDLIGGVFKSHPWVSADTEAIKVDDPKHPLNAAFKGEGFWIRDEIYQIVGAYSRDQQRVLLSLDMSKPENARTKPGAIVRTDNDFPISWIKQTNDGVRVFYCSLGHNPDVYSTPQVLRHYLDGIQFALGDLSADATPAAISAHQPALAPDVPHPLNGPGQPKAPAAVKVTTP